MSNVLTDEEDPNTKANNSMEDLSSQSSTIKENDDDDDNNNKNDEREKKSEVSNGWVNKEISEIQIHSDLFCYYWHKTLSITNENESLEILRERENKETRVLFFF